MTPSQPFVDWFRHCSPYINAFRGRTFVILFEGELISERQFTAFAHDIALLNSLGIRLVLVHGSRPQIEARLKAQDITLHYQDGIRITDEAALQCVKEATGQVRIEIEALLSMGLANMAGADIRVASGNYVIARPIGVRDGVDFLHTGVVRRIDHKAITQHLDQGAIALLSPLGYSPTGEVFNLTALEVATHCATALKADKLICLTEEGGLFDENGALIHELDINQARRHAQSLTDTSDICLDKAIQCCEHQVRRVHFISRHIDGALLQELFTRDGIGTMITTDTYEGTRQASIDDVGGILALITPLEENGVLVRRPREHLETEIANFSLIERDGMVVACAALRCFPSEGVSELECLAVHPDYQHLGYGNSLLRHIETQAQVQQINKLLILTTQTAHWFQERDFKAIEMDQLPIVRQRSVNNQRRSKAFIKTLR